MTYPADWTALMARERASLASRERTVVDRDREEHNAALRNDPSSYRWVGSSLLDVYDVPDEVDA